MATTTLVTWGYYGWGSHSLQLVEAVDAVERNGPDQPLSQEQFTGGVTYRVPVSFEVDLESGQSEVVGINGIAWLKWRHLPN